MGTEENTAHLGDYQTVSVDEAGALRHSVELGDRTLLATMAAQLSPIIFAQLAQDVKLDPELSDSLTWKTLTIKAEKTAIKSARRILAEIDKGDTPAPVQVEKVPRVSQEVVNEVVKVCFSHLVDWEMLNPLAINPNALADDLARIVFEKLKPLPPERQPFTSQYVIDLVINVAFEFLDDQGELANRDGLRANVAKHVFEKINRENRSDKSSA